MKTEMVSYCLYYVCEKLWWTYILQRGGDSMSELYHHGVKGMKWGVRRTKDQLSRKTSHTAKNRKNNNTNKVKATSKTSFIKRGFNFMQQDIIQQQMNQNFINWSMQESTRASINAANQAASLGMSGGMNPFMFGMM